LQPTNHMFHPTQVFRQLHFTLEQVFKQEPWRSKICKINAISFLGGRKKKRLKIRLSQNRALHKIEIQWQPAATTYRPCNADTVINSCVKEHLLYICVFLETAACTTWQV
jgi:hypothetical protein